MPRIPLIQSEVSAFQGTPNSVSAADTFGGATGRAVQGLGATMQGVGAEVENAWRAKQQEDTANLIAGFDYSKRFLERQTAASADAKGFYDQTRVDYASNVEEYTNSLPENVRQHVRDGLMRRAPTVLGRAAEFEMTSAAGAGRRASNEALVAVQNRVFLDDTALNTALADAHSVIDAQTSVPAAAKADMKQQISFDLTNRHFEGLLSRADSPERVKAVEAELAKPEWTKSITAENYERLVNKVKTKNTEIAAKYKAEATSSVADLASRDGNPTNLIDPQDIASAEQKVIRSGDPDLARRFYQIKSQQQTFRDERGLSPTEIAARRNAEAIGTTPEVQDARRYLRSTLPTGKNARAVDGLSDDMALRLGRLFQAAPPEIRAGLGVLSGYRTNEEQQALFNASDGTGHMVARPGNSQHEKGNAADVMFNGRSLKHAPANVVQWVHDNAGQYGLNFPLSHENWHIETVEARGGSPATPGTASQAAAYRNQARDKLLEEQAKALKTDMMTYGENAGTVVGLGALNSPEAFAERGKQALKVADVFNIPHDEATPLTAAEVTDYQKRVRDGTSDDVLGAISELRSLGGDMARAAFKQIGKNDPVFEHVAGLAQVDGDTATDVVRGRQRVKEDTKIGGAIDHATVLSTFDTHVGAALNGLEPRVRAAVRDAAWAYYVETSARTNNAALTKFDSVAYGNAVNKVLGGEDAIANINGRPTVLPRGVTANQFDTAIDNLTSTDLARLSADGGAPMYAGGDPVRPQDIAYNGRFVARGANAYLVDMGDGKFLRSSANPRAYYTFIATPEAVKSIASRSGGRRTYDGGSAGQFYTTDTGFGNPVGGVVGNGQ